MHSNYKGEDTRDAILNMKVPAFASLTDPPAGSPAEEKFILEKIDGVDKREESCRATFGNCMA